MTRPRRRRPFRPAPRPRPRAVLRCRVRARVLLVVLLPGLAGCGHATPAAPVPAPSPSPSPSPVSLHTVAGAVFYDENGNGTLAPGEDVRLPHVVVTLGGRTAESDGAGSFAASEVPAGTRAVGMKADTLPPFFQPGRLPTVPVPMPEGTEVTVPAVLPIGGNRPNVYLAFGDSVTAGDGSRG